MARSSKKAVCNFYLWYRILFDYLQSQEVRFTELGYPSIPRRCFVENLPPDIDMLPISKRSVATNPSKTILCSFEKDSLIYQHIRAIIYAIQKGPQKIRTLLKGYESFYAIAGFDLSVCTNSVLEEQRMFLLLNQMVNAFFAVNGLKILPNIRIGSSSTIDSLLAYPRGVCCCTGMLGCFRHGNPEQTKAKMQLRLLLLQPVVLVIYGKVSLGDGRIFQELGMPFISLIDYNRTSRNHTKEAC